MALKATVHRVELAVSDVDRQHYETYSLTIARHPSENDARMMVRLLAFAINAHSDLVFCKGLSTDDEPALWQKSLDGLIDRWIEVGTPSVRRIRKACGLATSVQVLTYQEKSTDVWWKQSVDDLQRHHNLEVLSLTDDAVHSLAALAKRSMQLQVTIQDSECWVSDNIATITVRPAVRKSR
jgi:uncharacterized protein YaeQ